MLLSMPCQPGGAEALAPPDPTCALSLQSKGSLEVTESQSADAEPPPPPKPDLSRYTGLRTHLTLATTEGKEGTSALAAAGRGAQGCTRQAKSQGRRADLEHISIPGRCMWPLALGEACGMLAASSALPEAEPAWHCPELPGAVPCSRRTARTEEAKWWRAWLSGTERLWPALCGPGQRWDVMGRACGSCFPQQLETPQLSQPWLGSAARPCCPLRAVAVCVSLIGCPDTPVPCTPRVSPSRGCHRGTEVPAPHVWLWGQPFLSFCLSHLGAPPLQPIPLPGLSAPGSESVLGQGGRGSLVPCPQPP